MIRLHLSDLQHQADTTSRNIFRSTLGLILTQPNKVRFPTLTPTGLINAIFAYRFPCQPRHGNTHTHIHTVSKMLKPPHDAHSQTRTHTLQRLAAGLACFDWLRLTALVQWCASCVSPPLLRMPPSGEPRGHHNLPLITLAPQSVTALQGPAKSF